MENADAKFMRLALEEAREAAREGEVPVGAVLVHEGQVVATSRNSRERSKDPTAHAEIIALRSWATDSWRREGTTLYVTKEPCVMCAGALMNARVARVVYGCPDVKAGGVDSVFRLLSDERLNHRAEVLGGVLEDECAAVLRDFFKARRGGRVVECVGLENRCGGNSTEGSNPSLSAITPSEENGFTDTQ